MVEPDSVGWEAELGGGFDEGVEEKGVRIRHSEEEPTSIGY